MSTRITTNLQKQVEETFITAFGRTPTRQRLEDIFREALELSRATDFSNMKEEVGDLLASAIMLCAENDWRFEDMIQSTLQNIAKRRQQYQSLGRKISVVLLG